MEHREADERTNIVDSTILTFMVEKTWQRHAQLGTPTEECSVAALACS